VTKHLAANTIEPKFATPERPSKIDPFAEKLADWLKTQAGKSRKQRRTMKQLHTDLVALGFTGSYARVAAFARRWRADRQREQQTTGRGTVVPLHFDPGDAFQFDWSEDFAVLGGERAKLQMAQIKLSHSRAFLLCANLLQTHEMLFDAHWHEFRVFGGVPGRRIPLVYSPDRDRNQYRNQQGSQICDHPNLLQAAMKPHLTRGITLG
jgi:hypothetical protein